MKQRRREPWEDAVEMLFHLRRAILVLRVRTAVDEAL
jgi:hypothetical protein